MLSLQEEAGVPTSGPLLPLFPPPGPPFLLWPPGHTKSSSTEPSSIPPAPPTKRRDWKLHLLPAHTTTSNGTSARNRPPGEGDSVRGQRHPQLEEMGGSLGPRS